MVADEPDDGVAHLPVRPVGGPLRRFGVVAWVGVIGQSQVGAENIDAGLPVLRPVIGQPRHSVNPGQPDSRWLITAQPVGSRSEPFVQRSIALLCECFVQLLTLVCERCCQLLALLRECGVQLLALLFACLFSVAAGAADAVELRSQGTNQGEDADAACNERSLNTRTHNRNLVQLAVSGGGAR